LININIKYWKNEEKFDILVSELLGGFGDNELSPEIIEISK
jgi:hypothetical protein